MGFLKKVKSRFDSLGRKAGLSRRGSKIARALVVGDATSLLRNLQRSHVGGTVGKSLLPSNSNRNLLTRALMSVNKSLARSALRSATSSQSVNTADQLRSVSPGKLSVGATDYSYRRLSELM